MTTLVFFVFSFFLKIALALLGLFCFHTNSGVICSSPVINAIAVLTGIALKYVDCLSSIVILTNTDSPNLWAQNIFPFVLSSSISHSFQSTDLFLL